MGGGPWFRLNKDKIVRLLPRGEKQKAIQIVIDYIERCKTR